MSKPRLLLIGEDRSGALARSLRSGLQTTFEVIMTDPAAQMSANADGHGVLSRVKRRLSLRYVPSRVLEAVQQLSPNIVLFIKGRSISSDVVANIQAGGVKVACYYPDNPWWSMGDKGALDRLVACNLGILWSERLTEKLRESGQTRVATVPFGYDPEWFPVCNAETERNGIAFLGTWSPRRERYLAALEGLPVTIAGHGWVQNSKLKNVSPPIYEQQAGDILAHAQIGINLLHPQCAGAHNMRTREITASGALEVTDPGEDGTPLSDGSSCRWFSSPDELRSVVEDALSNTDKSVQIAAAGQLLTKDDTYSNRGHQIAAHCMDLLV
jgi:spore maturation protein CgeB